MEWKTFQASTKSLRHEFNQSPSYAASVFLGLDFWSENSSQCNCLVCSPSEGPLSPTPAFVHLL